jgi:hypothetical protein
MCDIVIARTKRFQLLEMHEQLQARIILPATTLL